MNREPANKSMGFFGMHKEAFKITFSRKKIFSQITLAILLPLTILLLSQIQVSYSIRNNAKSGSVARYVTEIIYAIFTLFFTLLSTSSVVYTIACIYTSRETTFKRVIGIFPKVWGRLIVTYLWCLLFGVIYFGVAIGLFVLFFLSVNAEGQGKDKVLIFSICLLIPLTIGLLYMELLWTVAMVMSILENDYGRKALGKSMKLIRGKICISFAVFLALSIGFSGVIVGFTLLVVQGLISSLVGKIFVGIACYLAVLVLIHYSLVIQTIVYFVCKSHHNENLSSVAKHLDVGYANLGGERDDIPL